MPAQKSPLPQSVFAVHEAPTCPGGPPPGGPASRPTVASTSEPASTAAPPPSKPPASTGVPPASLGGGGERNAVAIDAHEVWSALRSGDAARLAEAARAAAAARDDRRPEKAYRPTFRCPHESHTPSPRIEVGGHELVLRRQYQAVSPGVSGWPRLAVGSSVTSGAAGVPRDLRISGSCRRPSHSNADDQGSSVVALAGHEEGVAG